METFVSQIGRVRLGPVPVPYIFAVALIPLWTSFSSHENSLLLSICVIVTINVKGSLLSCWILIRVTSTILQGALVTGVMVAQMIVLQFSLHASLFSVIVLVPPSTFTGVCIFKLHLWGQEDDKVEDSVPRPRSSQVIGIFSRSGKEEYVWLTSMLKRVGRVVPFCITNSNSQQFRQEVSRCTFAILYHSKNRGRVNITDVTDSLYDDELQSMSRELGKSNVIVVADDMDDSSPQIASSILSHQPSITKYSRGLYIFTPWEKKDKQLMEEKVQPIYNMMSTGSAIDVMSDLVLVVLVAGPWLYFICSVYHMFFLITTNLKGSFLVYYAMCAPNTRDSVLPSTHPIQRQKNSLHFRKKKGARVVGLAAVLVLTVAELSSLYWVVLHVDMVLIISQSLMTGAFILKMSMS